MVGVTTFHPVVLAADDVLLREGLAGTLDRSGFEVVGPVGDESKIEYASPTARICAQSWMCQLGGRKSNGLRRLDSRGWICSCS
jgi:hypothetical protein